MADKHPNDDYINPVSPTAAAPIPPVIDADVLAEQRDETQKPGGVDRVIEREAEREPKPAPARGSAARKP